MKTNSLSSRGWLEQGVEGPPEKHRDTLSQNKETATNVLQADPELSNPGSSEPPYLATDSVLKLSLIIFYVNSRGRGVFPSEQL